MNGFWGAQTDAVRAQGTACAGAAARIEDLLATCDGLIGAVTWIGPDAEAFREHWRGRVRGHLQHAIETLRADGEELHGHAEEQDGASGEGAPVAVAHPAPFPFPRPPRIDLDLPRCPVSRPEPEVFRIGFPPQLTLPRPPVCPTFPPPVEESWPLPRPDVHLL